MECKEKMAVLHGQVAYKGAIMMCLITMLLTVFMLFFEVFAFSPS